jgi:hypothetical protein
MSFLWKQESSVLNYFWIPAFAGMTIWVYFNNRLIIMKALFYKISPDPSLPKRGRKGRTLPKRGNPSLRSPIQAPAQPPARKSLRPGERGFCPGGSGLRPGGKREVRRDFAR